MRKKLLLVTTFDYEGTRWGRNYPLARAFVRNGFDVTMLVTEKRRSIKPYIVRDCEGVKVVCINAILPFRIRKLPVGLFTISFLIRMIYVLFHKFDYVYSDCGETPCAGWPCIINKMIYKSKYLSEYGDLLGKGGFYDLKSKLFKVLFGPYFLWSIKFFRQKADYVIVLSEMMRQYVISDMKIPDEKIALVPGGSLPDKIEYAPPISNINSPIYFGYIGVDDFEIQGALPLLKVLNNKYKGKFKIKLYGSKLSDRLVKENNLADIIVEEGWVDVISGQKRISTVDIFVLMKDKLETAVMGWPNKLGDYLTFGRPVMISPYGDLVEFVHDYPDGFIVVDRTDDADISKKIDAILAQKIDLVNMGKYNRSLAENVISWDVRIANLINILQN